MPMKTTKGVKPKSSRTIAPRRNVKKGTANAIYDEDMKQDNGSAQRWQSQKKKYEYKGEW